MIRKIKSDASGAFDSFPAGILKSAAFNLLASGFDNWLSCLLIYAVFSDWDLLFYMWMRLIGIPGLGWQTGRDTCKSYDWRAKDYLYALYAMVFTRVDANFVYGNMD